MKLQIKHNNCFGDEFKDTVIYLSPTIKYAQEYSYDGIFNGKEVKVVFQCRIKPGTYKKNLKLCVLGTK